MERNATESLKLGQPDARGFFKDAFNEYVVDGNIQAVNPEQQRTKAGLLFKSTVPGGVFRPGMVASRAP